MNTNPESDSWLSYFLAVLVFAAFTGWYIAESDNEILIRELAQAKQAQLVRGY